MKPFAYLTVMILVVAAAGCSSQRQTVVETDPIYYSQRDRALEQHSTVTVVEAAPANEFSSTGDGSDDGYFIKGSSRSTSDSTAYYSADEAQQVASRDGDGNTTVNNFYGNTNYYEADDYGTSYATRIRRFNSTNVVVGYGYYDPFFIDPYWNYGWSYWDPWARPGWSIGYNSWYGWNVGYNWGYWNPRPYYGAGWAYSCWPYCNYYGGWGGPWGYNNYWNGYNNGYWNGYNDGLYSGGWYDRPSNRRGYYQGRRGLANETGFVSQNDRVSPNNGSQRQGQAGRVGIVDQDISSNRDKGVYASADKLNRVSALYQVSPATAKVDRAVHGDKATVSQGKNTGTNTVASTPRPVNSRVKYEANQLARAPKQEQRYGASAAHSKSQRLQSSPSNQGTVRSPQSGQPSSNDKLNRTSPNSNAVNRSERTAPVRDNYYRSPERDQVPQNTGRSRQDIYQPQRNTVPSRMDDYQQSPSRNNASPNRYERPSSPNRSRSIDRGSGSVNPSPSRSVSPSAPSRSVSPSQQSAPSRSVSPSRSSSPSRGSYSPPSRSSRPGGSSVNRSSSSRMSSPRTSSPRVSTPSRSSSPRMSSPSRSSSSGSARSSSSINRGGRR